MPKQKFHYYTIRNVLTGEPTLVKAKNQAQASRRFFDLRFSMELTSQEDLLKFARADVKELDVTGDPTAPNKSRQPAQPSTTTMPPAAVSPATDAAQDGRSFDASVIQGHASAGFIT